MNVMVSFLELDELDEEHPARTRAKVSTRDIDFHNLFNK